MKKLDYTTVTLLNNERVGNVKQGAVRMTIIPIRWTVS
ncbi:hypothetical protein ACNKHM_26570 [Shigella sonnei]